jgi:hypothetical protein
VSIKSNLGLNMNRRFIAGLETERPAKRPVCAAQVKFTHKTDQNIANVASGAVQ